MFIRINPDKENFNEKKVINQIHGDIKNSNEKINWRIN